MAFRRIVLLAIAALGCAPPVRADEPPAAPSSREARDQFVRSIRQRELDASRHRERAAAALAERPAAVERAIAEYQAAEALVPSPETPFLLGEA